MNKDETTAEAPVYEAKAVKFTKETLLRSTRFSNRRDLLGVILKDGKLYSVQDAEIAVENYLKGKVK